MSDYTTRPVPKRGILSTEYGIRNGEVYAERGGVSGPLTGGGKGFSDSVPLSQIRTITHSGWVVGNVFFKLESGTIALTWENVFRPGQEADRARAFKAAAENETTNLQKKIARKGNVKFSDKVLEMPMMSGELYRGVYYRSYMVRHQIPQTDVQVGHWVDRGSFLCSMAMLTSMWGSKTPVITAPVSGRILTPPSDIFGSTSSTFCAIQLAEGEEFPDEIASSYREFVDVAFKHAGYLFRNSGSHLSDQEVKDALQNVRDGEYKKSSLDDAGYRSIADTIDRRFCGLVVPGDSW